MERAIRVEADTVSFMIYVGSQHEADLLEKLGQVADECEFYEMSLLAEMIPSKPCILNPYDASSIAYSARIGAEYGADVIKTFYSGSPESFRKVTSSVPIPVMVLGGHVKEAPRRC